MKHTGGQRIKPGSDEEKLLRDVGQLPGRPVGRAGAPGAGARSPGPSGASLQALTVRRLTHSQYDHTVRDLLGDQIQPASSFPEGGLHQRLQEPVGRRRGSRRCRPKPTARRPSGSRGGVSRRRPARADPRQARVADRCGLRRGVRAAVRPQGVSAAADATTRCGSYPELVPARRPAARRTSWRGRDGRRGDAAVAAFPVSRRAGRGRALRASTRSPAGCRISSGTRCPSDELLRGRREGRAGDARADRSDARGGCSTIPRAEVAMDEFLAQWMRFDRVLAATRDRRRFREFNAEVAAAMVEETRRLFNHLVWNDQNFMEFFTADYTFVNTDLARLYGLPAPAEEFAKVEYPAGFGPLGRAGARQLPGADQQAGRNVADRAGPVRPQPVSRPRSPAAAAGREHVAAERHGRRAADEPPAAGRFTSTASRARAAIA